MITKKSAVMIPVMLYRMIIATAVVGDFVNGLSLEVPFSALDASVIVVEPVDGACSLRNLCRSNDDVAMVVVYTYAKLKSAEGVKAQREKLRLYSTIALRSLPAA